jgi:hypothetical protein
MKSGSGRSVNNGPDPVVYLRYVIITWAVLRFKYLAGRGAGFGGSSPIMVVLEIKLLYTGFI